MVVLIMTLFSDADLDGFSALAVELALKDDCDILEEVSTPDGQGGQGEPTDQVVATVKCAVIDASRVEEYMLAQKVSDKVFETILLPRGTQVSISNRLRVAGQTYHIEGVNDPTTYEVLRRVSVWREH
jgi:hypothetical protein